MTNEQAFKHDTAKVAFEYSSHLCKHSYLIKGYLLQVVFVPDMLGFSWDYTKFVVMCKSRTSPGVIKHLELNTHMKEAFLPFQKQFSVEGVCEMHGVPHFCTH